MEMKVQYDTRVVLSFKEEEILKLLTYLEYSELSTNISPIRTYDNEELEDYVYGLAREVTLLVEDKLRE